MSVAGRNEKAVLTQDNGLGGVDSMLGHPWIVPKQSSVFNCQPHRPASADYQNLPLPGQGDEHWRSVGLLIVQDSPNWNAGKLIVGHNRLSSGSSRQDNDLVIHDERGSGHPPSDIRSLIVLEN